MKAFLCATAIAATFLLGGCGNARQSVEEARAALPAFHDELSLGDAGAIYDSASPEFRTATSRLAFLELGDSIRRRLGKVTGGKETGWTAHSEGSRAWVDLTYQTAFERGQGTENFTFVIIDGKVSLYAYRIDSPNLLTR